MESIQTRIACRVSWKSARISGRSVCQWTMALLCILPFVAAAGRPGPFSRYGDCWPECGNELSKPSKSIMIRPQGYLGDDLGTISQASGEFYQRSEKSLLDSILFGERSLLDSSLIGSSPPQCTSKCGSCKPCSPAQVAVHPGLVKTTEYYPEAWRCKCREKLYMP